MPPALPERQKASYGPSAAYTGQVPSRYLHQRARPDPTFGDEGDRGARRMPMAKRTNGANERHIPGPEAGEFQGFDPPRSNWFRAPNALIDRLPTITSQGELAVVLYCLRHTWGWNTSSQRITLDEFEHGRKRKDGSRMDGGTGMSRTSIIRGLKRAVEHGFLDVTEDGIDAGRMSKRYAVRVGGLPSDG